MKEIKLTRGFEALIDDEDYNIVSKYKWYADVGTWTVYAKTDQAPGRPRMHALILAPPKGLYVHHADGNGLNNLRSNISIVTRSFNARSSKIRVTKQTARNYRGVYERGVGMFIAEVTKNYKKTYIGTYNSAEEAALAYNDVAKVLLGEEFIPNDVS